MRIYSGWAGRRSFAKASFATTARRTRRPGSSSCWLALASGGWRTSWNSRGGLRADALGEQAERAAERLARPDVLTDFGLRTLSSEHAAFAAHNYHRGSVWPFDSWLGWGGLRTAGLHDEAERVRAGVLLALDALGGAPELYAVGEEGPRDVALANRIQAWTVGARWALENGWDGRTL